MVSFILLPTLNNSMAECLKIHLWIDFNVFSFERFPVNFAFGSSLLGPCNVAFARRKDCSAIKIPCSFSFSLLELLCEEWIVSVRKIQLRFSTENIRGGLYKSILVEQECCRMSYLFHILKELFSLYMTIRNIINIYRNNPLVYSAENVASTFQKWD